MSADMKVFLSMSFSGSVLILALFLGKRLLKDKISRQWQYYIWLVAVFRLLIPFGPEVNLLGKAYQAADQAILRILSRQQLPPDLSEGVPIVPGSEHGNEKQSFPAENPAAVSPAKDTEMTLSGWIRLIWLAAALGLIIRKVTIYQGFIRYLNAGSTPVSDIGMLNRLSVFAEQIGVKRPVELYINPLVSSPLLAGFFHPCIVLPRADIPEKDFGYIILHELTHYKRRDMLYKGLVQLTVCLHWFNPFVHLMSREITRACEFSCDEAVLAKAGAENARDYGKTLLDAMAAVGKCRKTPGAVTLSENKQLLKERIDAIMNFRRKSKPVRLLTGALTLSIVFAGAFAGIYPVEAAGHTTDSPKAEGDTESIPEASEIPREDYAARAERYYEADSLPLFEIAFYRLDETTQRKWVEKFYEEDDIAFFSVAVRSLDKNDSLFAEYAEKAYAAENTAFFSVMADCMDTAELEAWLERALEDGVWSFQSMLSDRLVHSSEYDEREESLEKEWEEEQAAQYRAAGVTVDGKEYYFQGQLVNIFLDIRSDNSFYALNMNPEGTVNIKIIRDADNTIKDVVYMTEEESAALLGDIGDQDDSFEEEDWLKSGRNEGSGGRVWYPRLIPVNRESLSDGEIVWLGEYTLSEGDRIWYAVFAETGDGLQVGFARPGDEELEEVYYSMHSLRQEDGALECIEHNVFGPPAAPGTYELFIRATDGPLGNVTGSVSIGFAADATWMEETNSALAAN